MYSVCLLHPPILLSLTYNIKYSSQFYQISLPIPHTTCIYAHHARPVTVFTQHLVRESWFIQNLPYIFLPPPPPHNIFDILHPSQTSLHINSLSLISLFHFSSHSIFHHTSFPLTLPLPHLFLRFTSDFFPLSSFFFPVDRSSLRYPVRGSVPSPSNFSPFYSSRFYSPNHSS